MTETSHMRTTAQAAARGMTRIIAGRIIGNPGTRNRGVRRLATSGLLAVATAFSLTLSMASAQANHIGVDSVDGGIDSPLHIHDIGHDTGHDATHMGPCAKGVAVIEARARAAVDADDVLAADRQTFSPAPAIVPVSAVPPAEAAAPAAPLAPSATIVPAAFVTPAPLQLAQSATSPKVAEAIKLLTTEKGDPFLGNPNGSVVIYEFTDYNCGLCKRFYGTLQQVIRDDGDIKVVVKEYPIIHQTSHAAARAGVAAQMQGVFPAFHNGMMLWRGRFDMDAILKIAAKAGADPERLRRDMQSDAVRDIVRRTRKIGKTLKIRGTPGLVVGGKLVPGSIGLSKLKRIVAEERARKG